MKWPLSLVLIPLSLFSETIPVDVLIDFESGSHGDNLTTAYLDSVTRGSGLNGWTASSPEAVAFTVNTDWHADVWSPFWIRGTAYENGSSQSRCARIDMGQNDEVYYQSTFTSPHNTVTVSFDLYFPVSPTASAIYYDLVKIYASEGNALVAQIVLQTAIHIIQIHIGSPSSTGNQINFDTSVKHRISLKYSRNAVCTMEVWRLDTHELVGISSSVAFPNVAADWIRIGTDPHVAVSSPSYCYFDNVAVDFTAAKQPLGPGNGQTAPYYVRSDGDDANNGLTNSVGGAWATITNAAAVMSPGDIVHVQNGTYTNLVNMTTDGVSGAYINYVAQSTNVTVSSFNASGDYTRIIGFGFTGIGSLTNYTPIITDGATGVQILDNYFYSTGHGTSSGEGGGIRIGNSTNLIVRGNLFEYCGTKGSTNTPTNAKDIANYDTHDDSTNVLVEYNVFRHSAEYINPSGSRWIIRNNVFGPTTTDDWNGAPHIDVVQANAVFRDSVVDDNWHVENPINDSHFLLCQGSNAWNIAFTRNVSIRSGDRLNLEWTACSNLLAAHNIVGNTGCGPDKSVNSSHPWIFNDTSLNFSRNNIFTNVTTDSTPYAGDGTVTHDHDIMFPLGGDINEDPLWVDYGARNLLIQVASPAKDAGGLLTATTSSGSSESTVTVTNAYWFHDGFGLTVGSSVYVGANNNLTITNIDTFAGTFTVSSVISWNAGDSVGFAYRGAGPDIGPYEYGDTILSAAYLANVGTTYTVTTTGDAQFVVFYQDGIPHSVDYTVPYSDTITSGTVTAKAYALHPQGTPSFDAGISTVRAATAVSANVGTITRP